MSRSGSGEAGDPFYAADLAHAHESGFTFHVEGAAPAIVAHLGRRGIGPGAHVVDLGCGGGTFAGILVDAGYRVTGIDVSPAMVRLARRRVPGARFRVGSLDDEDVPIPEADAVTALGEVFNYLVDPRRMRAGIRRVHAALRPEGAFVFDLAEPARRRDRSRTGGVFAAEDWVVVSRTTSASPRRLTRHIDTFRRIGSGDRYRRSTERHELGLVEPRVAAGWLRETGFRVQVRRGYGPYRFPFSLRAYFCRRV